MNRTFAVAALLAALAVSATAQVDTRRSGDWRRDQDRNRDWGRDWSWDRDRDPRGASVENLARRAERESNSFRAWFERNYSRSTLR